MTSLTYIQEKWAQPGFQKYFKNTSWIVIARITVLLANFLTSVYIARELGPENYGTVNFIISFTSIAGFTLFATDALMVKKLHAEPERTSTILGSSFVLELINAAFTMIVATTAAFLFARSNITTLLVLAFSTFSIFQSFTIIDFYFQAHANTKRIALANILTGIISAIIKFLIVYAHLPIVFLLLSYTLDQLFVAITYIYLYQKHAGNIFHWKATKEMLYWLISHCWPFTLSAIATAVYVRIDQVFLKVLLGSEAVGLYVIAVRFSEVWFFISGALCAALMPAILNAQKTNRELFLARIKKLYVLLFFIAIVICLFIFIIAPYLVSILYGPSYAVSAHLLRIYIWSITGVFLGTGLQQFLIAENKFKTILMLNIVGMILSLVLNAVFIPQFGIAGAAYANIFAYSVPSLFIFYKKLYT